MHCRTCHYSLEGLTGPSHRCPECGTPFDPRDPHTFLTGALVGRRRLTWVALVAIIVLVLLFIAAFIPVIDNYLL